MPALRTAVTLLKLALERLRRVEGKMEGLMPVVVGRGVDDIGVRDVNRVARMAVGWDLRDLVRDAERWWEGVERESREGVRWAEEVRRDVVGLKVMAYVVMEDLGVLRGVWERGGSGCLGCLDHVMGLVERLDSSLAEVLGEVVEDVVLLRRCGAVVSGASLPRDLGGLQKMIGKMEKLPWLLKLTADRREGRHNVLEDVEFAYRMVSAKESNALNSSTEETSNS
jgi:hypothetical protein